MSYNDLKISHKLRVDAHLLDHIRDNKDGFADNFRRAVRETAHSKNLDPYKAYVEVLNELRDGLSVRVNDLAAVNSQNITLDRGKLDYALEQTIGSFIAGEIRAEKFNPVSALQKAANDALGNLNVPADSRNYAKAMGNRADELLERHLRRDLGDEGYAAVQKLRTSLGDHEEARQLQVAARQFKKMGVIEAYSPFSDGHVQETKDAVIKDLKSRGVNYQPSDVSAIVQAAIPIADDIPTGKSR